MDLRGRRDDRQYSHRAGLRRHHGWARLCRLPDPEACNPSPEVSYVCYSVEAFTSDLLHRARCQAGRQTRSSAVASVCFNWVIKGPKPQPEDGPMNADRLVNLVP